MVAPALQHARSIESVLRFIEAEALWSLNHRDEARRAADRALALAQTDERRARMTDRLMQLSGWTKPAPWMMFRLPDQYVQTPDADPVYLYQDALFGLAPEKGLNNGQPRHREAQRLYRTGDVPEERCWVRTPSWSLAYG